MAAAGFYAAAGERELTIDRLEIAREQRYTNIPYLGIIPLFRMLHDHPRFRKLADEVGVPLTMPPEHDPTEIS